MLRDLRSWALGLTVAGLTCCGDSPAATEPICAGNGDAIALYYTLQGPVGQVLSHERVIVENGFEHLVILEDCSYFAYAGTSAPHERWNEVREGTIDEAEAWEIANALQTARWSEVDGLHVQAGSDLPHSRITDVTLAIDCIGDCGSSPARAIRAAARDVLGDLVDAGAPVAGDVRVYAEALPADLNRPHPTQPLPDDLPIEATAHELGDPFTCYGEGALLGGGPAEWLRTQRAAYRAGEHGSFWYGYIPVEADDGTVYAVTFRDALPIDGPNGLVTVGARIFPDCP